MEPITLKYSHCFLFRGEFVVGGVASRYIAIARERTIGLMIFTNFQAKESSTLTTLPEHDPEKLIITSAVSHTSASLSIVVCSLLIP